MLQLDAQETGLQSQASHMPLLLPLLVVTALHSSLAPFVGVRAAGADHTASGSGDGAAGAGSRAAVPGLGHADPAGGRAASGAGAAGPAAGGAAGAAAAAGGRRGVERGRRHQRASPGLGGECVSGERLACGWQETKKERKNERDMPSGVDWEALPEVQGVGWGSCQMDVGAPGVVGKCHALLAYSRSLHKRRDSPTRLPPTAPTAVIRHRTADASLDCWSVHVPRTLSTLSTCTAPAPNPLYPLDLYCPSHRRSSRSRRWHSYRGAHLHDLSITLFLPLSAGTSAAADCIVVEALTCRPLTLPTLSTRPASFTGAAADCISPGAAVGVLACRPLISPHTHSTHPQPQAQQQIASLQAQLWKCLLARPLVLIRSN